MTQERDSDPNNTNTNRAIRPGETVEHPDGYVARPVDRIWYPIEQLTGFKMAAELAGREYRIRYRGPRPASPNQQAQDIEPAHTTRANARYFVPYPKNSRPN